MTARDVLELIQQYGGSAAVERGKLKLRAPEPLPDDLMDLAREHKPELLALLQVETELESAKGPTVTTADSWAWIEERSAIMEIEAGLTREQADLRAFTIWFDTFIGGAT